MSQFLKGWHKQEPLLDPHQHALLGQSITLIFHRVWFQVMWDVKGTSAQSHVMEWSRYKREQTKQVMIWVDFNGNRKSCVSSLKLECLHTSWFHNSRLPNTKLSLSISISHLGKRPKKFNEDQTNQNWTLYLDHQLTWRASFSLDTLVPLPWALSGLPPPWGFNLEMFSPHKLL